MGGSKISMVTCGSAISSSSFLNTRAPPSDPEQRGANDWVVVPDHAEAVPPECQPPSGPDNIGLP
jgi:hypothetical protein